MKHLLGRVNVTTRIFTRGIIVFGALAAGALTANRLALLASTERAGAGIVGLRTKGAIVRVQCRPSRRWLGRFR